MSEPLRIVTYNVRYFAHALRGLASTRISKQAIALRLAELKPRADIICLQEVETISIRSKVALRKAVPRQTQLEDFMSELESVFGGLREEMPYDAFYFRAHNYKLRGDTSLYTTGLAILVNKQTVRVEGHNVESPQHITHHHVERLKERKQSRICAHVKLLTPDGKRLHIFNTHLSLPTWFHKGFWQQKDKMGFGVNQVKEAETLAKFVKDCSKGEPYIVCGDFNSPPGSSVFKYLTEEAGLVCVQSHLKQIDPKILRGFPTAGFMRLRMHLDHLFCGGPIEWLDLKDTYPFGHPDNRFGGLSDHVPLIARFRV